mmetsp:Transcript_99937/g.287222  ORF Transcript_99937/g.287222 Transcript_99937/m.287222 type:complete len:205 (-) Transcript_99937:90-704(-)
MGQLAVDHRGRERLVDPDERGLGMEERVRVALELREGRAQIQVRLRDIRSPQVLLDHKGPLQEGHRCAELAGAPVVHGHVVPSNRSVNITLVGDLLGTLQEIKGAFDVVRLKHPGGREVAGLAQSSASGCDFRTALCIEASSEVEAPFEAYQEQFAVLVLIALPCLLHLLVTLLQISQQLIALGWRQVWLSGSSDARPVAAGIS